MGVYDEDFRMYQVESANSLNQEREAELSAAYRESMKASGMSGTMSARADDYDMAALADSDLPDDILSPRFSKNLLIGTHDAKTGVNLLSREAIEPDAEPTLWRRVRDHLDAEMDFLREDVFEFGMESGLQVAGMYEDVRNNVLNVTADIAAAFGAPEEELVRGEPVVPDPQNTALAVGRGLGAYAAQYVTSRAALIKSIGQPATLMGRFGVESAAGAAADFMSDPRTDSLVDFVSSIFNQERVVAETYKNNPMLARGMLAGEGLAIGGLVEGVVQIPAAVRRLGGYADDLEQIGVDRIRRSSHKLHAGVDPEGLRGIVEYMTAKILKGANALTDGMREELVHTGATGQQLEEAWEQAVNVSGMAEANVGQSIEDILAAGSRADEVSGPSVADMSPEELAAYGDEYGVNLRLTDVEEVTDPGTGNTFSIPGGLDRDKPLTITDAMWLKSQAYDAMDMSPEFQTQLQRKLLDATTPESLDDPTEMFNRIMFGLESPNTPLLTNQFMTTRMRARTPEDIDALADLIPWEPGATVPAAERRALDKEIGERLGIAAQGAGGMGMRSSVDLTNVAEFAKLYRDNPDFFQKAADEPWENFAERLMAVQRGLSPKTASFGAVWQAPGEATISAMDRHMARNFRPVLMADRKLSPQIRKQRVKLWNEQVTRAKALDKKDKAAGLTKEEKAARKELPPPGAKKARSYNEIMRQPGAEAWDADQIIKDSTKHRNVKYRLANGEINPEVPEHLRDLPIEPKYVTLFGEIYRRMLAENERLAMEQGLNTFGEQWRIWDRIRQQIEPHESMHRDVSKLPRMTAEQLEAAFKEQKSGGFFTSGTKTTGERYAKPFDYQKGLYWGGAGAAAVPLTGEDEGI